jgi:hypothetical protein
VLRQWLINDPKPATWFRLSVNLPGLLQTAKEWNHQHVLITSILRLQKFDFKAVSKSLGCSDQLMYEGLYK